MSSESTATDLSVFKVPVLTGKGNKSHKTDNSSLEPSTSKITSNDGLAKSNSYGLQNTNERRPLVSFKTKSMALPAEVYKPHRPTATEFLERHLRNKTKLKKEDQQEKAKKIFDSVENVNVLQKATNFQDKDEMVVTPDTDTNQKTNDQSSNTVSTPPTKLKPKPPPSKLNYTKPSWSVSCDSVEDSYSLEVLRAGAIIDKIEFAKHEYFVFGRLPECDITLEHPSISRYLYYITSFVTIPLAC